MLGKMGYALPTHPLHTFPQGSPLIRLIYPKPCMLSPKVPPLLGLFRLMNLEGAVEVCYENPPL